MVHILLTWSDGRVSSEQVQPPAAQAEVFDDVKDLHRFLYVSHLWLLSDNQVDVHVGVDEVAISAPPHCPLDSHQAVLLQ